MAFELELPAFLVDQILFDQTPTRPILLNRDPEPGETNVPIGTNVSLDITDSGTDGVDESATKVFVNGALAFNGGTFQSGFTGPGSSSTAPQTDTRRIVIDPTTDFLSLETVVIRVVSETVGGANTIDISYQFTTEDLTAPIVVAAQARDFKRVRVSFDESVKQVNANQSDDALNPANYVLEPQESPAVSVVIQSVETVTDTSVELVTDIELSSGKQYKVTVDNVEDLFGNAIGLQNTALFTAFRPTTPAGRAFDLFAKMPLINRREDADGTGDLLKFLSSIQDMADILLSDSDRFATIYDPDLATESFLDAMLADLGNPFPFDLSEVDKRRLLDVLVAIYKEKGTAVGIENAVRFFLGFEITINAFNFDEAWVLGESELGFDTILGPSTLFELFSFEVIVNIVLTDEQRDRLNFIVEFMKPAHTHFVQLVEPTLPETFDHLELGISELGVNWILH